LPVIESLAAEYQGTVSFVKVNTTKNDSALRDFGFSSYPAYVLFRDGVEADRLTLNFAPWFLEERLRRMIDNALDAER